VKGQKEILTRQEIRDSSRPAFFNVSFCCRTIGAFAFVSTHKTNA